MIKSLRDREDTSTTFSQEDYDKLIDAGVDKTQFISDGEEFIYIGESIDALILALQINTKQF